VVVQTRKGNVRETRRKEGGGVVARSWLYRIVHGGENGISAGLYSIKNPELGGQGDGGGGGGAENWAHWFQTEEITAGA